MALFRRGDLVQWLGERPYGEVIRASRRTSPARAWADVRWDAGPVVRRSVSGLTLVNRPPAHARP